ncbi:hypothetical protein C4K35_3495 [Pseudomonas chlororaphis subsp. piscium]|nr:hypothetical protein C4K35_3495 [Pseudomonas chlororaphis subsp. piscium]AZC57656.1 hypothetical protein C4K34_3491 [Pseudomonas chlororaphis subsp. piscium]AZC63869.1 hypothetical protein C4K33_3377 [Pseudomonas chlororaphis subsp. piscium]AZC70107.1 hypothetical protein C4K32_3445 [Pseudomonas chlororaphis subsp. piscium]AZC76371.1 hypothetical protein C4K31_3468 [Pseudomonas chlororaphis subsp. piscium]
MSLFSLAALFIFARNAFLFLPAASAHILCDSRPVHQYGADSSWSGHGRRLTIVNILNITLTH